MRWIASLLVALAIPLAATYPRAGEKDPDAGLSDARAGLVDAAQAYRASLERLLAIQQVAAGRADAAVGARRRLYADGIVSRAELATSETAAAAASAEVDATRRRLAEAQSVLAEGLAALDLAQAASVATSPTLITPNAIGARHDTDLTPAAVHDLDRFFAGRFARPLPVSARGQTSVHDRLGLDHRQAIDVAVHPDSEEGRALIDYLLRQRIPFLAFRGVLPGASTGAHVHVGRASARLLPASGRDPLHSGTASRLAR